MTIFYMVRECVFKSLAVEPKVVKYVNMKQLLCNIYTRLFNYMVPYGGYIMQSSTHQECLSLSY